MAESPGTNLLGVLGSAGRAEIDGRGTLRPLGAPWWLTWSVGAEDRWHEARGSASVRQRAVGDVAVFETAMRVPGGDVLQRAYGVHLAGTGAAAVVEFENRSAVPVALALRAETEDGSPRRLDADGAVWRVDGVAVAVSSRPPGRDEPARGLVFPLTHTAVLRALVPLEGTPPARLPATLPPVDRVVAGWRSQIDRGVRLALPDPTAAASADADRAQLLLLSAGEAIADRRSPVTPLVEIAVGGALGEWGFDDDADLLLLGVVERFVDQPRRQRDPEVAAALLDALARRRQLGRDEEQWAATAFARAEATRALRARRRRAPDRSPPATSSSASPPSPAPELATRLRAARLALVADTADGVELLPSVPTAWFGQPVEVHGAPIAAGRCSFAVRWHGARPALLWEIEGFVEPRRGAGWRLRAPGLDPSWSTAEPRGEALLAAPAAAGTGARA